MPTLIAGTSGSWSEAGTWKVVDATAELDGENYNNYTEVATSPSWGTSSTFSFTGSVEVDAIAVKVRYRATSPTGTFSVCIGQGGSPVAGTTVTINATDIMDCTTGGYGHQGWMLFKFSSPVTLSASTNYTVMAQESSATSDIQLLTDGTASNWLRQLRTTTTQAPAVGDKTIIAGEWTAATTVTAITVTMNNNDTTDYGTGSTTIPSLSVCNNGTLSFSYTASTNLRLSGVCAIYAKGTLNIGTVANPIGSSYTAKLEFDCAANNDFGIKRYTHGVLVIQGASLSYDRCMLAADAAASATSITTSVSTGWKDGDIIVIAPTDRTYNHSDYCVLNGDASGTTVNLTTGLSYAHSSATLTQAEIIHLTRNAIITSVNSSYKGYIQSNITYTGVTHEGSIDADWAQFIYLTQIQMGSGDETSVIQRCSVVSCDVGIYFNNTGTSTQTVSYNVGYGNGRFIHCGANSGTTTTTVSENWAIGFISTSYSGINTGSNSWTLTNNRMAGMSETGFILSGIGPLGTVSGNIAHSCGGAGIKFTGVPNRGGKISGFTSWFNAYGFETAAILMDTVFEDFVLYGNSQYNIRFASSGCADDCVFDGGSLNGYSGYATQYGVSLARDSGVTNLVIANMSIGVVSGSLIDHSTGEVQGEYATRSRVAFYNCTWGTATKLIPPNTDWLWSFSYSKDGGVEGVDYSKINHGTLTHNLTAGDGGTDCLEITPSGNTSYCDLSNYLSFNMFQCPAQDGITRTVYVKLKKTATLDSTNVSLALYQNGTLVDGWDNHQSELSSSTYIEFSLSYTPTEDGILDMAIKLDGDAGSLYVDSFKWV